MGYRPFETNCYSHHAALPEETHTYHFELWPAVEATRQWHITDRYQASFMNWPDNSGVWTVFRVCFSQFGSVIINIFTLTHFKGCGKSLHHYICDTQATNTSVFKVIKEWNGPFGGILISLVMAFESVCFYSNFASNCDNGFDSCKLPFYSAMILRNTWCVTLYLST